MRSGDFDAIAEATQNGDFSFCNRHSTEGGHVRQQRDALTGEASGLYQLARFLGDAEAIHKPHRIPRRLANKIIGRGVVRRLWR